MCAAEERWTVVRVKEKCSFLNINNTVKCKRNTQDIKGEIKTLQTSVDCIDVLRLVNSIQIIDYSRRIYVVQRESLSRILMETEKITFIEGIFNQIFGWADIFQRKTILLAIVLVN